MLVEERDGDNLTLLHLRSVETEEERRSSRSVLNCYDMGGHTQYYCAQQIFRNQSSIYLLTFQRYIWLLVANSNSSNSCILSLSRSVTRCDIIEGKIMGKTLPVLLHPAQ